MLPSGTVLQALLIVLVLPVVILGDGRYLLYDVSPTEGFNLRRDVYMRVARIAQQMHWTLVLPPWGPLPHWKGPNGLPWSMFFDLASLNNYTSVIEFNDFMDRFVGDVLLDEVYVLRHAPIGEELDDTFRSIECATNIAYRFVDGFYHGDFFGRDDIKARKVTCLEVSGTGSALAPLLNTGSLVMFDHAEVVLHDGFGDKEYWRLRRSMVFAQKLRDEADNFIKSRLGGEKYLAVHLRRSDFPIVRPNDVPSIKGAAQQVRQMLNGRQLKKVFLSTDGDEKEVNEFLRLIPEAVTFHKAGVRFENSVNLIENSSEDRCANSHHVSGVAIPGQEPSQCSGNRGDLDKPCRPLDEHCGTVQKEQTVKALPMEEKILPAGGSCQNEHQYRTLISTKEGGFQPSCGEPVNPLDKPCIVSAESCNSEPHNEKNHESIGVHEKVLKTSHEKCENPHSEKGIKKASSARYEPTCGDNRSLDQPCMVDDSCPEVPVEKGEPQLSGKADTKAVDKGRRARPTGSCSGNDGTEIDMSCQDQTCASGDRAFSGDYIEGASKSAAPSHLTEGQLAIVDQIICSHAEVFVGSFESTFSFRIQEEREILGKAPDTTFNRLCADGDNDCQQPTRWTIIT